MSEHVFLVHPGDVSGAPVRPAMAQGFRLVWNRYSKAADGGVPNLEVHTAATCPGVVAMLDEPALAALDARRAHPRIYRRVLASGAGGRVDLVGTRPSPDAWIYLAPPSWPDGRFCWPTPAYLAGLLDSLRSANVDPTWIGHLEKTTTLPPGSYSSQHAP